MIGMRPIWASAWGFLAVICLTIVRANADTECFPPRALVLENPPSGTTDISESLEEQFSVAFGRMNEPSLWKLSQGDKGVVSYRFLLLPTWNKPVAVRIERTWGRMALNLVRLDGQAGYDIGQIDLNKQVSLSQPQWERLTTLVEGADFWDMPARIDDLGCDGADLIVEGVKDGEYHVVHRWSPQPGAYTELCRYMLDLTGMEMGQKQWPAPPPSRAGMWVLVGFLGRCLAALLIYAVLRWVIYPRKPCL